MKIRSFLLMNALFISTFNFECNAKSIRTMTNKEAYSEVIKLLESDPTMNLNTKEEIKELLTYNLLQDLDIFKGALAVSGVTEIATHLAPKNYWGGNENILHKFNESTRFNILHKTLMAFWPGRFADRNNYSGSYLESLGFSVNDLVCNYLLKYFIWTKGRNDDALVTFAKRLTACFVAHAAWNTEKQLYNKAKK